MPNETKPKAPPLAHVDVGLLEYLKFLYPDMLPSDDEDVSQKELWMRVGQQKVIKRIAAMLRRQERKE